MTTATGSLRALFEQALPLDHEARQRWLHELRAHDPDSAARLQRMLTLDAQQADPFGRSIESLKQSLEFKAEAWLGRDISGFKLVRLLGEGGMGAVFLAERNGHDFQQQAAVKLLHGHWLDERAAARFADEARILARLNHPNIATFIDAGSSADGRPFLVMEYIDGKPLLAWCDQARLSVFQRLRLAHGLLSALGHAHRHLVVHRDLKPANVLVTPDGTPKLLDFGIARLIANDTAAAVTTTRPFTPDYASPEQLAGEPVGTASDVYSLGLLLYQLCTGVLPWDAGTRSRTGPTASVPATRLQQLDPAQRAQLATQRGCDARQLSRNLRGDLGRVLSRCLEPDPALRYSSVDALERDLAAVAQGRPPPGIQTSRAARAASFSRRHAWPLALAALLLVAGAIVLTQSLLAEQRLAAERDRALAAAAEARTESAKSRQVANFVETMLSGIDPDRAHGMDRSLMRLILDSAGQRAHQELAGQPALRMAVERTIANSYNAIGEYSLAVQHYDAALQAARKARSKRTVSVNLLTDKARALSNQGAWKQAVATIDKATQRASGLPASSPARLYAESNRAGFKCDAGKWQACRESYASVLPQQRQALGDHHPQTLESMRGLAFADTQSGRFEEAREIYHTLLRIDRHKYGVADSRTLGAINGLAILNLQAKQYKKAEALLTPAVKVAIETFGADHPLTINLLANLGGAIRQQPGRNAEARPYYEQVLTATLEHYGPDNRRSVIAQINLASLLRDAGALQDAERHARLAVQHMHKALPAGSAYRGIFLDTLGTILVRANKYPQAQDTFDQAWSILNKANGFGPDSAPAQALIHHYVSLYRAWGKPKRVAQWRDKLIATRGQHASAQNRSKPL